MSRVGTVVSIFAALALPPIFARASEAGSGLTLARDRGTRPSRAERADSERSRRQPGEVGGERRQPAGPDLDEGTPSHHRNQRTRHRHRGGDVESHREAPALILARDDDSPSDRAERTQMERSRREPGDGVDEPRDPDRLDRPDEDPLPRDRTPRHQRQRGDDLDSWRPGAAAFASALG